MANNWVKRTNPSVTMLPGKSGSFSNRRWGSMHYDATRKVHHIWEGYNGESYLDGIYSNCLYEYDYLTNLITQKKLVNWVKNAGTGTSEPTSANTTDPTPCDRHPNFCYGNGKLYAFGGLNANVQGFSNPLFDTWFYDIASTTWTAKTPSSKPGQGATSLLVCLGYSPFHDKAIVGSAPDGTSTRYWWLVDTSSGEYEKLEVGPSGRGGQVLAYDTARKNVLLFGGGSYESGGNELWRLDVGRKCWGQLFPTGTAPSARAYHGWAYDSAHDVFLLHGGSPSDDNAGRLSDTWLYNPRTNAWTSLSPATTPTTNRFVYMTYDPQFDQFVMFNDSSEIWTYQYQPASALSAIIYVHATGAI